MRQNKDDLPEKLFIISETPATANGQSFSFAAFESFYEFPVGDVKTSAAANSLKF